MGSSGNVTAPGSGLRSARAHGRRGREELSLFAVTPGVSRSRAARPHVFGAASCWTPQHTPSRWEVESWLCRSVWRRVGGFGPCESALRLVTLGFQVPAREVPGGPLSTSVRFSKSTFVESGAWSNGLPARPWWRAAQSAVPCGLMTCVRTGLLPRDSLAAPWRVWQGGRGRVCQGAVRSQAALPPGHTRPVAWHC